MKKKYEALVVIILVLAFIVFTLTAILIIPFMGGFVGGQAVGVIPIRGEIVLDSVDTVMASQPGAREVISQIESADEDPFVSVILLDINSGGGSVVASKEIMRAVKKAKKPVVAYVGEVGASGAYLIASAADEIVTDEDSLTGSLGAVMMLPNYVGLMEKIGVNVTLVGGGEHKTMGSPFEQMTEEEKEIFEALVESAHQDLKETIAQNRAGKISEEKLDEFTDGRIFNGKQALGYGLVDHVGSRELALERAAKLGRIEGEAREKVFSPFRAPFGGMFSEIGFQLGKGFLQGLQSESAKLET